jgi:hypothetical protein
MLLARTVTHATVAETKRRMTRLEFLKWAAAYQIEPWGDEWNQVRAIAASSVAPWSKRRINLSKYFPNSKRRLSAAQIEAGLAAFAERYNRRIERQGRSLKATPRARRDRNKSCQ